MATYRFRKAESVESPRLAVGAPGLDFVLGEPAPDTDEQRTEYVDVNEADAPNAIPVLIQRADLDYDIVDGDNVLSPEEAAAKTVREAVQAERDRQAAVEEEGRREAEKLSVPSNSVDVAAAVREAVDALQPQPEGAGVNETEASQPADVPPPPAPEPVNVEPERDEDDEEVPE